MQPNFSEIELAADEIKIYSTSYSNELFKECISEEDSGYFFYRDDILNFFVEKGFEIKIISDDPAKVTAGRFLRFLAKKE